MSFSSWMTELRTQEHPAASLASGVASSWAETDCDFDSDSDSDFGSDVFFGNKKACKSSTARKLMAQRTAPIAIPQATFTAHARSSFEFWESPAQHRHAVDDYDCRGSTRAMDINEEDLMLFGNLAYFRTQHGATSGIDYYHQAPASCALTTTISSIEDEQIFDMEL